MKITIKSPSKKRISTAPPGRGWRPRPEIIVNADYVRKILEQNRLTERDETLFQYLKTVPVLNTNQIKRLLWYDSSPSNMSRRLRQLYDMRFLDRTRMLKKADGIIYTLGKAAQIWLGDDGRPTAPLVNTYTLAHDIAVSEVMTLAVENMRANNSPAELIWRGEAESRIVFKDKIILEPDGTMIWGEGPIFLEVDMDTEGKSAFTQKIERYYRAARLELLPDKNQKVFIVTPTRKRAQTVAGLIKPHIKNTSIFWFVNDLQSAYDGNLFNVNIIKPAS